MATPHVLSRPTLIQFSWLAATGAAAATVGAVIADIVLWAGQRFEPPPVSFIQGQAVYTAEMLLALAYAAMGWLLASRLPRNVLGWIFLWIGFSMAAQMTITFLVQAGHQAFRQLEPLLLGGAWLVSTVHLPSLVVSFALIFLLFPEGRPLSRRWALAGWLTAAGALLVVVGVGLSPEGLIWYPSLANPLAAPSTLMPLLTGIAGAGLVLMVGGVLTATRSMVVRYRSAGPVQRAQLRWVAFAVLLLAACGLPFTVARYGLNMRYAEGELLLVTALAAGGFLPIAAAIAVLRRRLYDIDLILNRALVYIPLTGILGGLYAAGVALFQRIFQALTGDKSDAAVVITTLVLAGMFTPVRNALQAFVDKRFKPPARDEAAGPPAEAQEIHVDMNARLAELESRVAAMEDRTPPPG